MRFVATTADIAYALLQGIQQNAAGSVLKRAVQIRREAQPDLNGFWNYGYASSLSGAGYFCNEPVVLCNVYEKGLDSIWPASLRSPTCYAVRQQQIWKRKWTGVLEAGPIRSFQRFCDRRRTGSNV